MSPSMVCDLRRERDAKGFTNHVMGVTACPTIQPNSERFRISRLCTLDSVQHLPLRATPIRQLRGRAYAARAAMPALAAPVTRFENLPEINRNYVTAWVGCRTRTGESARAPSDWNSVTTSR